MVENPAPKTDLQTAAPPEGPVNPLAGVGMAVQDNSDFSTLLDSAKFNQIWRVSKLFSESKLVPAHFQKDIASVFVAMQMALRMGLDPMMVMQNTYMVGGRPGMEAKLVIALVNARGPFTGPIQWRVEGEGKGRQYTAYATHAKTGELCQFTVTWEMVEGEGWSKKAGSKWLTMPDLMFRYRSAAMLARLYCPEVIMGLSTVEELEDSIMDAQVIPFPAPALTSPSAQSEVPPADLNAVAEFDAIAANNGLEPPEALAEFLELTAKANGLTVDQVKTQATESPEAYEGLATAFQKWAKKPRGTTRSPRAGEVKKGGKAPPTPSPESQATAFTELQGPGPIPTALDPEEIQEIFQYAGQAGKTVKEVCDKYQVSSIDEMDRATGNLCLGWLMDLVAEKQA